VKILDDGFKIIEDDDDIATSIIAMCENIVLLHEEMKKLQEKEKPGN